MKMVHVVGGVAVALSLVEPGFAADAAPSGAKSPCPILRPMAKCALEGRAGDTHAAETASDRSH